MAFTFRISFLLASRHLKTPTRAAFSFVSCFQFCHAALTKMTSIGQVLRANGFGILLASVTRGKFT
ncbi:hypothetical protein DCC62_28285 [candidate division KSB1 bacterium]|nr:MAG: hypothetical protein DCC62_28285 [candidate division KSB1 bacterium]